MGYLDDANINQETKKLVRDEMWLLCNDLEEIGLTLKGDGNK